MENPKYSSSPAKTLQTRVQSNHSQTMHYISIHVSRIYSCQDKDPKSEEKKKNKEAPASRGSIRTEEMGKV